MSAPALACVWGFDPSRLDAHLKQAMPALAGDMVLEPIAGGQSNPTFFVTYPDCRMVLRKKPSGVLLPSAHAIDREYRIMQALAGSGVPVPRMLHYHPDPAAIGTAFYVMERLEGRVFADCALPQVPPAQRQAMYLDMAGVLARLHSIDWRAAGLGDFGKAQGYFSRQLGRWSRQWQLSKTRESPDIERLLAWFAANLPEDDCTTIVHGDYRLGNLMFHPTEPRVVGVLDWELSTLGHPASDLSYCALAWRLRPDEYMGMRGLDGPGSGIPTEEDFVQHYVQAGAHRFGAHQPFHVAFALFRLAVIFEGITARAQSGAAVAQSAASVGALSSVFARRAMETIT